MPWRKIMFSPVFLHDKRILRLQDFLFLFVVLSAPVQLYCFPYPFHWLSSGTAAALLLAPALMEILSEKTLFSLWLLLLLGFGGLQLLSLSYSPTVSGAGGILLLGMFVILISYGIWRYEQLFPNFLKFSWVLFASFALEALMMLLFRFNPECEAWFWQSGIGSFLINPHRDVTVSNLTDPLRGGGFLECAQTAALLMFSAPIAAFAAWRFTGKWHWVLLWVLYACGLAATGGKYSILLLTGWLACGLLIKNLRLKCGTALVLTAGILIVFFLILPKCCAPPERTEQWNPRPLKEQWKGQNRVELWKIAWNVIADAPVLGAGYGGWNPYYASQRGKLAYDFKSLNPNPHNIYLLTWIRSGVIPALLLVGAIPLYLLLVYRKTLRAAPGAWDECFMWGGLLYTMFATGLIEDIFFWGRTEYLVPLMAMAVIRSARLLNETRKKTVGA